MRRLDSLLDAADERRVVVLAAVVVAAVGFGAIYCVSLGDGLRYQDEGDYLGIARNLADGRGFSLDGADETAYRPPGYPLLLWPLAWLGAGVEVLRFANFVALAAIALVVYLLVRRVAAGPYGLLAATAVVVYPFSLYIAGTLYPQIAATLPIAGAVLLTHQAVSGRWIGRRAMFAVTGSGLLMGASILMVPNHLFSLGVLVAWTAWVLRRAVHPLVVMLMVAGLVLPLAWTVRNLVQFDEVVFVSSNSGLILLAGNSENARPNTGISADISRYRDHAEADGLDEFETDRYFRAEAVDWVTAHPGEAAGLYVLKVANYFNPVNDLYVETEESSARSLVAIAAYAPLLLLLGVRLLLLRRFPPTALEALLLVLYLANAPFMAIFFTRVRYRLPFDLLLFAAMAMFLAGPVERWRQGRRRAPASVAVG